MNSRYITISKEDVHWTEMNCDHFIDVTGKGMAIDYGVISELAKEKYCDGCIIPEDAGYCNDCFGFTENGLEMQYYVDQQTLDKYEHGMFDDF